MEIGKISFEHFCKNVTDRYIAVGNCVDVIGYYDTREEAAEAVSKISVGQSKWFGIFILGPGESKSLNLQQDVYPKVEYTESMFKIE